jgi:hypothetical protein
MQFWPAVKTSEFKASVSERAKVLIQAINLLENGLAGPPIRRSAEICGMINGDYGQQLNDG